MTEDETLPEPKTGPFRKGKSAPPPQTLAPPSIDGYRLLQRIGAGGMGEVWEAEQLEPIRRRVALKLIKPGMDTERVIARFEAERQALALMDHSSIASVFDAGTTREGRPYFVMELVRGESITRFCDHHRLSIRNRLELFLRVCDGVQHAHQRAVIHRDVKPSNVLVTFQDDRPVAKIIDFGIAKAIGTRLSDGTLFTQLGDVLGTPEYMSPEQIASGGSAVDTRTDVYSLGVLLYELIVGALPYDSAALREIGLEQLRRQILEVEPPKPSTRLSRLGAESRTAATNRATEPRRLVGRLKGDLDWIVIKAMEKDRARRYASVSELAADIRRHLSSEPILAGAPGAAYRMRKFARRHRGPLVAATLVFLSLVGGIFGTTVGLLRARAQAREARTQAAIAEAVNQFLNNDLLAAVSPENQGRDVSMRDVLDAAAERIDAETSTSEGRFAEQPLVEAAIRYTLGETYYRLGVYDRAQPHLERALALRRSILGERDIETLTSMVMLALLERARGEADRAVERLEAVVATTTEELGPDHEQTLEAKNNLASVYYDLGRFQEALDLLVPQLEHRRASMGSDHPSTLSAINNLASLYLQLGRHDDALPLFREVLEARRRTLGDDHPSTLISINNLGLLYKRMGDLALAEPLLRESLDRSRSALGPEHPDTLTSINNLAGLLLDQGRLDEAEGLVSELLDTQRRILGPGHLKTLASETLLSRVFRGRGDFVAAEQLTAETLARAQASLPPGHWQLGTFYGHHGADLVSLERFPEAETELQQGYEILVASVGERHRSIATVIRHLIELYEAWGREEKAEEWRARLGPDSEP